MQRMLLPLMIAFLVPLAGCLADDPDDESTPTGLAVATGAFYADALYDPATLDLDALSQPLLDILPVEEILVTATDGTVLHNAVYRPDTDEPVPVWINFSPYWGDTAEVKGDPFGTYMVENFVPRGYAVILASIRGTGHSGGCFEVSSDRELMDLQETIDLFAEQPWSNGNVGIGGKSYDSTPQNGMIAKFPTDNLKTIFHVSGITDWYEYQFHNGVLARADGGAFSAFYGARQGLSEYATINIGPPTLSVDDESPASMARLIEDAACPEMAEHIAEPGSTTAHGLKTPYWIERDWTRTIGDTAWDGSIFFYHGLQDWNVQPSHILPWLTNIPDHIDTKVWLHQDQDNGFGGGGHAYPMRTDWNLTMLRYMDQELKGIDTGFWDGPRVEVEGSDGVWRTSAWPLEGETQELLVEDGVVLVAANASMRYGGAPTITVDVTPLNPDPVFTAILYDEGPNGREWRNEAVLRLTVRDGLELPSPVVVGQPVTITAAFYPQDDVLEPGHQWVVAFQEMPAKSVPLPTQLEGLEVDAASATVSMVVTAAANDVARQPVPMACITCP